MLWIKEVESQISGRSYDCRSQLKGAISQIFQMIDAKTASALKKIISNPHFRRRVSAEEERAQKHDRFLRGRQIAHMIYDHVRATGACDAGQDLSDLFIICVHDDDIQDFDTRWDQALLSSSEIPKGNILDGLYKFLKYEILFSVRPYRLCTTKKLIETEQRQAIKD